jgi:zinc D-Ala-D-Ala carboxypeptidase
MKLSAHFSLEEFIDLQQGAVDGRQERSDAGQHLENLKHLAEHMEAVRALFGRPIEITSAYRNPQVNAAVGGVPTSAHALGHAADFHVDGLSDLDAAKGIRDSGLKFDQLIYEKNRCVHISFDPRLRRQVLRQPGGPGSTRLQRPRTLGSTPTSRSGDRRPGRRSTQGRGTGVSTRHLATGVPYRMPPWR